MPLKKKSTNNPIKANPHPVKDEVILARPDGQVIPLISSHLPLALVTLNANQFTWPSSFAVVSHRTHIARPKVDPETGSKVKSGDGKTNLTIPGQYDTRLTVVDGDLAQQVLDNGGELDALTRLSVTVEADLSDDQLVDGETLVQLVKPRVMLAWDMAKMQYSNLKVVCEDVKFV